MIYYTFFRDGGGSYQNQTSADGGSNVWSFCDNVIVKCPQYNFLVENLL